jgi:hypothetical protein
MRGQAVDLLGVKNRVALALKDGAGKPEREGKEQRFNCPLRRRMRIDYG